MQKHDDGSATLTKQELENVVIGMAALASLVASERKESLFYKVMTGVFMSICLILLLLPAPAQASRGMEMANYTVQSATSLFKLAVGYPVAFTKEQLAMVQK